MRWFYLLILILFNAGCTQGIPPLNFSVPNIQPSSQRVAAEVKSVTVSLARADEQESMFQAGDELITPSWKAALDEALNKAAIFQDDAQRKVSIAVKVLRVNFPPFAMNFTTTSVAVYQVLDRSSGAVLYAERIQTTGTAPSDFAFLGVARARESVNRSVQANIAEFISKVGSMGAGLSRVPLNGS